jgi:hypothetical protein
MGQIRKKREIPKPFPSPAGRLKIVQAFKRGFNGEYEKCEPALAGDRVIELAFSNNQVCDVDA